MPHCAQGLRIDPAASVPSASTVMPVATAAAPPPVEPPGDMSVFHGLRDTPHRSLLQ